MLGDKLTNPSVVVSEQIINNVLTEKALLSFFEIDFRIKPPVIFCGSKFHR